MFGHRRPLNAVVVMGLVLVAQHGPDVAAAAAVPASLFTAASLFLLIQMHAFDERATWIRRRIGDPTTISGLYLRGGTVFIVLAMVGAGLLTQRAASNPLANAWDGVDDQLIAFGERISRFLPMGGALRPIGGVQFGEVARISDTWITDPGIAFTATIPATEDKLKWRAATYDTYAGDAWAQTKRTTFEVAPGESILEGLPENPEEDTTRPLSVTVTPREVRAGTHARPGHPRLRATSGRSSSSRATRAGSRPSGWATRASRTRWRRGRSTWATTQELITGHRLEGAGTSYPQEIKDLYTGVPEGAIGPDARELLDTILAEARDDEPVPARGVHAELPPDER